MGHPVHCTPPTFDGAVLFLDLYDSGRPGLARGFQGHAGLVQALLPEVVGAALGASSALGFIRVATLISIQGFMFHLLHIYIHSVPYPWCTFCKSVWWGISYTFHASARGPHSHAFHSKVGSYVHAFTSTTQFGLA